MIHHIVVGDEAAKPLSTAIEMDASMSGRVLALKDLLQLGPIERIEGQSFSKLRSEWWQEQLPEMNSGVEVSDLEQILDLSNTLNQNSADTIWFWMAPNAADVCAYFWMLPYLGKHLGRLLLVNLANLPFLDEAGKLFYPVNISELISRELIKARKLSRLVSAAELEMDQEIWKILVLQNAGIRVLEGGKKLVSKPGNFYDDQLLSGLSSNFQKAGKIINLAMSKFKMTCGDSFLAGRLRFLLTEGIIERKGEAGKGYKDWDLRLKSLEPEQSSSLAAVSSQDAI